MSDISWFKFENRDLDFPFYKKNPHVPIWGWIVLFIALGLGLILSMGSKIFLSILSCVIVIVPVLYFLKWDYTAIFQKPSRNDVILAVVLCIGYFAYAMIMERVLGYFGILGTSGASNTITVMTFVTGIFSIMTEEFIKFIPFIFLLFVIYKYSDNRKLSAILSMIVTIVLFAFIHTLNLQAFIFLLLIQGVGSLFEFFGYFKTKNILIPYITHLMTDFLIYFLALFGF